MLLTYTPCFQELFVYFIYFEESTEYRRIYEDRQGKRFIYDESIVATIKTIKAITRICLSSSWRS